MFQAHLMGDGSFFDALRRRLDGDGTFSFSDRRSVFDSTNWPAAPARVLVTSARDMLAERHLHTVSRGTGQTWIPVQLEARSVRVGPVISASRPVCPECFDRRQEQHGRRNATDAELDRAQDGVVPVSGFTPAHIDMVAVVLGSITASDDRLAAAASSVWRFGHSDLSAKQAVVIPVRGCRRCDPTTNESARSLHLSQYFPR